MGDGVTKIFIQMFLSDFANIYSNTLTHGHIFCTLSLFPSLSLPFLSLSLIETHTHTHTTHTLTQSKSGRYELILRLLTFILRLKVDLRVQVYPSPWASKKSLLYLYESGVLLSSSSCRTTPVSSRLPGWCC